MSIFDGIFGKKETPPPTMTGSTRKPAEDQLYRFFSDFTTQLAAEQQMMLETCFGEQFKREYDDLRMRKSLEPDWLTIELNFVKAKCKGYYDWLKASNEGLQARLDALARRPELDLLSKDLEKSIIAIQQPLKDAANALKERWKEVETPRLRNPVWDFQGWALNTKLRLSDVSGKIPAKCQEFNRDFDAEYKRNALRNMKI